MKKSTKAFLVIGALAGVAAFISLQSPSDSAASRKPELGDKSKAAPTDSRPQTETTQTPTAPQPASEGLTPAPAWARDVKLGSNPTSSTVTTARADKAAELRSEQLQRTMSKITALQQRGNATPAEMEAVITELERINGSSEYQGLRLDVMRNNIKIAARMQQLAEELQALQAAHPPGDKPSEKSAAAREQINRKLAELQDLQKQIQLDPRTDKTR
jgi:hypothetical protein